VPDECEFDLAAFFKALRADGDELQLFDAALVGFEPSGD